MEKGPKVKFIPNRNVPEKIKEIVKEKISQSFVEPNLTEEEKRELEQHEISKTEEELKIIDLANRKSNELLNNLGLEPIDILSENVHFVDPEYNKNDRKVNVRAYVYKAKGGAIFFLGGFESWNNSFSKAMHILHEFMHLKASISVAVIKKDDKNYIYDYRRYGVFLYRSDEKDGVDKMKFVGLEEAIVSLQTNKMRDSLLKDPALEGEREYMETDEAKKIIKEVAEKRGLPEEDISLYLMDETVETHPLLGVVSREMDTFTVFPEHLRFLRYVINEIQKEFPEKYTNFDDVFMDFLRAQFGNGFLSLGKVIEKTFGKGSFRSLGQMTAEDESAKDKLEEFKKRRAEIISH